MLLLLADRFLDLRRLSLFEISCDIDAACCDSLEESQRSTITKSVFNGSASIVATIRSWTSLGEERIMKIESHYDFTLRRVEGR
jgi:hypothetical protein